MKFQLTILVSLATVTSSFADDWPQWMGPNRDNIWRETGLLDKFPEAGLKPVWRAPLAHGYAGPAVVGDRVFISDFVTDANVKVGNFRRKEFKGTERVLCLNAKTGKTIWKKEYPVTYNISYPSGPRCTPTVEKDRVYFLGAVGHLFCFDVKAGKEIWAHDLVKEYKTKPALWGYAAHPRIYGETLLCLAGGKGSHIVAFDKMTGKEKWKALTSPEQGYSPPTIIQAGGVEQLLLLRPDAVTSVNPKNGEVYWSVPYKASSGSIIMTPIQWKDHLYVGGYSNKNLMLKLGKDKPTAKVLWRDKAGRGISPVNVQPFLMGDVMYGLDQNGKMMAIKLPSGERLWNQSEPVSKRARGSETAFIVKQKDRFWLFTEKGELVIGTLSPQGFKEIDRTKIIEPTNNAFGRPVVWCAPAFANKRIYVRNDKEIICVDLSK